MFYWKNQNLKNVIAWEGVKQKMLTEYFKVCSIDNKAHTYLYREFPKYIFGIQRLRLGQK